MDKHSEFSRASHNSYKPKSKQSEIDENLFGGSKAKIENK